MTALLRSITTQPLDPDAPTGFDISVENATLAAQLNNNNREVIAASARLWQINTLARLMGVDLIAGAGRDDDGNARGYTLNSTQFNGEPYEFREGLQLAIYVSTTNAAGATLRCAGISGGNTQSEQTAALVSGIDNTALLAGALVAYRLYKVQWLHTARRWLVVGIETPLTQIRILAAVADEGIPWAKIDVPDGSIIRDLIADNAIDGSKVKDGAIDTDQLANGAVRRNQIEPGVVSESKMDDAAVSTRVLEDGSVSLVKLAADAIPVIPSTAWTTEIIDTTGSAVSHTITAKEVVIRIWGAGGGGGGGGLPGSSGGAAINTTLTIGSLVLTLRGGRGGAKSPGGGTAPSYPSYTDTLTSEMALQRVSGAGGGGGGGGSNNLADGAEQGKDGQSGDYLELFIDKTAAASITLAFNLGTGGSGGSAHRSGSAGAPARALLRYR